MELIVEPVEGRVDTVPRLVVQGLRTGGQVRLDVSSTDGAGHRWRSSATYPVGPDGVLLPDDPERPWWDMAFAGAGAVPVMFTAPDTGLDYEIAVTGDGGSARRVIRRCWGLGTASENLSGEGWRLRVYRPAELAHSAPGVVVVPGSTGVSGAAPTAALLAAHGYVTAVLAYIQEPGLPSSFREIPVEAIVAGFRAFAALPAVDAGRVGVFAASVGVVAALAALSGDDRPRVGGVACMAPTHVVWQALADGGRPPKAPMLTRAGRGLPYVPIRGEKVLGQMIRTQIAHRLSRRPRSTALELEPAYRGGLADSSAVAAAAIPVERIAAPVLAIAGEADAVWPAASMAQALLDRRRERGGDPGDRLLLLPATGHFLRPPVTPTTVDRNDALVSGGTPEGTARGQRAAWDATLEFFGTALQ